RDAVRLLRQPAVFIVAVDIVRILRDAVIRPHCECTVRVQLRVAGDMAGTTNCADGASAGEPEPGMAGGGK
ncbi:hypothetical protein ODZ18_16255, partial [Escherichia coli]|nr:hypothetical protein [Escherichia coli]